MNKASAIARIIIFLAFVAWAAFTLHNIWKKPYTPQINQGELKPENRPLHESEFIYTQSWQLKLENESARLDTFIPLICIHDHGRKVGEYKDSTWRITDTLAVLNALLREIEQRAKLQWKEFEDQKRRDSL